MINTLMDIESKKVKAIMSHTSEDITLTYINFLDHNRNLSPKFWLCKTEQTEQT